MGCQCCRMIKSYIYDPSVAVDVRKTDSAGASLYQPQYLSDAAPSNDPLSSHNKQKQGFRNMGYSKSNDSTLKLEVDNNHVNRRLHAAPSANEVHRQGSEPLPEVYIIQPEALAPRWGMQEKGPSQVPIYPNINKYENQTSYGEQDYRATAIGWDSSITQCVTGNESLSADEVDEGVGGTPEYLCDTGDEGSVLSVDIHTSTTSLSSADTRDELRLPKTLDVSTVESGISVMKSEDEEEARDKKEEVQSVTDSMVAEALAALEAATAGEDCE
ncbi:uncharacterized protein zgc:194930 [Micropterus salmoides]|uniref:uncharacterized protein zgc:194930 n=1 Tax=Micropterus salmoides TaxID=27706 RepID=UPI0018EA6FF3|nr:uncharacterized protein zgc:194930 [Micropterus salmoides]XP_038588591.1 uncharacterized protein zgc:194930 [Micropterus salmoides]XP_038588592.1 uncharacterized protein zgc:194930 [Micropterus salmoides]